MKRSNARSCPSLATLGLLLPPLALLLACSPSPQTPAEPPLVSGVDLAGFDLTVRPQDDFNAWVNGAWLRDTDIPADKTSWGSFAILADESEKAQRAIVEELAARGDLEPGTDAQRVGDFFASFMDTEPIEGLGAEAVRGLLDVVLGADSANELFRLSAGHRVMGIGSPLEPVVFPDLQDSTRNVLYLLQSGLTLPDRDFYLTSDEKAEALQTGLPLYAARLFELAGVDEPEKRGRAVLEVERRIAELHWPTQDARDFQKIYNPHDRAQLAALAEPIDWQGWLALTEVPDVDTVIVGQPSYLEGLGEMLASVTLDDWKSYFAFRILHASAPYLSSDFVDAHFEFVGRRINGMQEQPPRWQRGVRTVNALLGEAVGKLYVERHFPPEAKARMEELVENLIASYDEAIGELDWMTDETRTRAREKLASFTAKIGYPDEWRDYGELVVDRHDLIGNVHRAQIANHRHDVARLAGPVDPNEWEMTPQTVNAYYHPTNNEVVFPAAILQPPFFDLAADDAVNYGAIGVVIGHEMGHGFDNQGRRFDADGNMRDWWTEEDAAAYEASSARLVEQFAEFEPLPGVHVNGQLTLGENIGDLTGVTIAHRAYLRSLDGEEAPVLDGFTGEQRFFIGFAQVWRARYRDEVLRQTLVSDPHAPPAVRVVGTLRNSPEFYRAFDVQEGDGMWLPPEQRVKIW